MDIPYVISPLPSHTGDLKAVVYETSNPTAEVASQTFAPPHNTPRNINFTNLDKVPHRVSLYAMPANTLLHDWIYYSKDVVYVVYPPLLHVIGDGGTDTPLAGTSEYRNEDLADSAGVVYWVERRGVGTMNEGVEIEKVPEGGFDLLQDGDTWSDGETFIIHRMPQRVVTTATEGIAGKWFNGVVTLNTNTAYSSAHLRKLLLLTAPLTYSLPSGANMPIGFVLSFQTYGGSAGAYVITTDLTDKIKYGGANVDTVTLAQNEFCIVIWDGTNWQIVALSTLLAAIPKSDNPELNNSAVLATTVATKTLADRIKVLGCKTHAIGSLGDLANNVYTVTHNLNISGSYAVFGSIVSKSANHQRDADISWAIYDRTANDFKVIFDDNAGQPVNFDFDYMCVKL